MIIDADVYLAHYGTPRHSGRYPWGSGGDADSLARSRSFMQYVGKMREDGLSDVEIARGLGLTTTQLRAEKSIAKNLTKQADILMAQRLKDKGYSNAAIGVQMGGLNESTVRSYLKPGEADKLDMLQSTANMLRNQVAEKKYIDIGTGVEHHLTGVSRAKLDTAVAVLKAEGYEVHTLKIPQAGTSHETTHKVLAPPGTTQKDVFLARHELRQISEKSEDNGRTFSERFLPPVVVSADRVGVVYKEDGGADADGVIYVRRGVKDVSLGRSQYAQVRIAVEGDRYLKGMAIYKDDMPEGVDLLFNTNKKNTGNKLDAMKAVSDDPDSPFGAVVHQIKDIGPDGKPRVTSAMNLVNEEGDWDDWSRNLSSQMLSKQNVGLAKEQLDVQYERTKNEYEAVMALNNPAVKKKMLESLADGADASAVHMKAAALPRQATRVILPLNSLKENEVYAPTFRDGEKVVLIRFPHGGIFEIPELTVNNRSPGAEKALGRPKDAIGIHSKVAERLSGADFDGDTVLVIPNNLGRIKTKPALEGLKDFDTKHAYPLPEGVKFQGNKQQLMGDVSNLITDMTIRGASLSDLSRAVRHSMVVIDAEKHNLDYKQSAIDHGIKALKTKYQGGPTAGAATLVSRKKRDVRVDEEQLRRASEGGPIDPTTGRRVFEKTGRTIKRRTVDPVTGVETITESPRQSKVNVLDRTDDANDLSSGTPMERVYADHSNRMKALANQARLSYINTPPARYSPEARAKYNDEVKSLNSSLSVALSNAPLERQAQVVANTIIAAKRQAYPGMPPDQLKKVKGQALTEARVRTGAGKDRIQVSDREWEAIQAGAISNHKLTQILDNMDADRVKELATPRESLLMTPIKTTRAKSMWKLGYTQAEIADALGVSVTTLDTALS